LVAGVALIAIGAVVIEEARDFAILRLQYDSADALFPYTVWNEPQLVGGIMLALVGAAASSASLTYLKLSRKNRG